MTSAARSLAAALALAVGARAAAAQGAASLQPVADSVRREWLDLGRCLNAADVPCAIGHYADDSRFQWVERGAVVATSYAQMRHGLEQIKGYGGMHVAYDELRVVMADRDVALLSTHFTTTLGAGAKAVTFSGLITATLIRTAAGWRILSGHSSAPPGPH